MRLAVASVMISLTLVVTACAAPGELSRAGHAIQVGAFKDVRNAEGLAAKLQRSGVDSFYFRKDDGLFAVRFGDYPSRDAAKRDADRLVRSGVISSYFVAAPPEGAQRLYEKPRTTPDARNTAAPQRKRDADDMGRIVSETAKRFVGIPYRWGGNTVVDGLDCSGFTRAVYNLCGVNIPRTAREQYDTGVSVGRGDLYEGDLVFFGDSTKHITHVGIFTGRGEMVHAPKRGDDIKIAPIDSGYFQKRFMGARRYF